MKPYIKIVLKPIAAEPRHEGTDEILRTYRIKATDLPDDDEIEIIVASRDTDIVITTDKSPFK